MPKTLFVVNPHAGGGRGAKIWKQVHALISKETRHYAVVITRYAEDVVETIQQAHVDDVDRIISIGGDGTANTLVQALMEFNQQHPDYEFVYGNIPAGTGRDGARGFGIPLKTEDAIPYVLHDATSHKVDVGRVCFNDTVRYFLNVSSVGISNRVVQFAERAGSHPWTFLYAVIRGILAYTPEHMCIEVDGELWFEGEIYVASVANGKFVGQGLHIAPDAIVDDGKFDVVVAENMPLWSLARKFPTLYSGTHLRFDDVHATRGQQVRIYSPRQDVIPMDLDGEPEVGDAVIQYEVLPGALSLLL